MGKEAVNGNISGYWVWKLLMSQLCKNNFSIGDGHRNCPKSPFLARVTSVQISHTKWHFRATF